MRIQGRNNSNTRGAARGLVILFWAFWLFWLVAAPTPTRPFLAKATVSSSATTHFANNQASAPAFANAVAILTTVAGNGMAGFSGDNGAADSASLNFPFGVAVDEAGNFYIADSSNHRIRKVDSTGVISTVAGNGIEGFSGDGVPAAGAELNAPVGVAVDCGRQPLHRGHVQ